MPENLEHYLSVFVTYMHVASKKTLLLFFKIYFTEENYYGFIDAKDYLLC